MSGVGVILSGESLTPLKTVCTMAEVTSGGPCINYGRTRQRFSSWVHTHAWSKLHM